MALRRLHMEKVDDKKSLLVPQISFNDAKMKTKDEKKIHRSHINPKLLKFLGMIVFIIVVLGTYLGIAGFKIYKDVNVLIASGRKLEASTKDQNLVQMKLDLDEIKTNTASLSASFRAIAWMKVVPFVGKYVEDGTHGLKALTAGVDAGEIAFEIIEPYADILGFGASEKDITAQERIDFIVKTIPEIIPKSDDLARLALVINSELTYIDPADYPEKVRDVEVRSMFSKGKEGVQLGANFIANSKPLLEQANYLLGVEGERTYLVLFQNDKELRPTGGFITAYSIGKVRSGKFEPVISDDIYNLDNNYKPSVKAPAPLVKHIKGPYLLSPNYTLRDMNWDPSFVTSMELFAKEVAKTKITPFDGIIAVDTQLLVNILEVIGPIDVPGYGVFNNTIVGECNCPQVIYELESFADNEGPIVWSENEPGKIVYAPPNYDNRKKIIGPLMNSILSSALGQPKEKIPLLFEAGLKSLLEKHILVYTKDEKTQRALVDFGIAGALKDTTGDYLHINDANLGGRKSNLYATQDIALEIETKKDKTLHTLIITYKNPQGFDGWLNSILPNYTRIYVPKGAKVIDVSGFTEKEAPYEEHGKSVIPGFFELRPQGVSKVSVTYETPAYQDSYTLFIQKQPGKDAPLYTVSINGKEEEFFLKTDKEIKVSL